MAQPLGNFRPLNRFSIVQGQPPSSEAFIRRPSSVGHERGAYPPIIIFGIGNSAPPSWKSGCSLM